MSMGTYQIDIAEIMRKAGGYAPESFPFIRDGLAHASNMVHGESSDQGDLGIEDASRHVSGQQLCLGLRDLAIQRYGLLARTVLNKWGIFETRDFGNIIFALVDANLMRTTEDDSIEDFELVYTFDEAFEVPASPDAQDEPVGA
jgi:uncharacterized repeat protein (TIGR04138 family)